LDTNNNNSIKTSHFNQDHHHLNELNKNSLIHDNQKETDKIISKSFHNPKMNKNYIKKNKEILTRSTITKDIRKKAQDNKIQK